MLGSLILGIRACRKAVTEELSWRRNRCPGSKRHENTDGWDGVFGDGWAQSAHDKAICSKMVGHQSNISLH